MSKMITNESAEVREHILAVGRRVMAGKGFSAVGLTEILNSAGVPKGSFYYYFASKDAFGVALIENYFADYVGQLEASLQGAHTTLPAGLIRYFDQWRKNQLQADCHGKCLVVKLGAEVADLSEPMRLALNQGTARIVAILADAIERAVAGGSLAVDSPRTVAESLYQLWLGASIMAKITRDPSPFDAAMQTTKKLLHIPA